MAKRMTYQKRLRWDECDIVFTTKQSIKTYRKYQGIKDVENPLIEQEYELFARGQYVGTFKTLEVKRGLTSSMNPGETWDGLEMSFANLVGQKDSSTIKRTVGLSFHPKSKLYAFVAGMAPGASAAELKDKEGFWKTLEGLVGGQFLLTVSITDDGKYNRLEGAVALPAHLMTVQTPVGSFTYELIGMDAAKQIEAISYASKAGAKSEITTTSEGEEIYRIISPKILDKLSKYEVKDTIDKDQINF